MSVAFLYYKTKVTVRQEDGQNDLLGALGILEVTATEPRACEDSHRGQVRSMLGHDHLIKQLPCECQGQEVASLPAG